MRPAHVRMWRAALTALMSVRQPSPEVLVAGFPDTEENAHVAALELVARYGVKVTMLAKDPAVARRHMEAVEDWMGHGGISQKVDIVRRERIRDARAIVRAQVVMYTHGLSASPAPRGRRLHVNLWHGTGAKRSANTAFTNAIGASAISANAAHWARQTADDLLMSNVTVLPGTLREALYSPEPSASALSKLGLEVPFVLWMPTYRTTTTESTRVLRDGTEFSDSSFGELVQMLANTAESRGVRLLVKAHPLDPFEWGSLGVTQVTNEWLADAGVPLYGLIGQASGMISDYSSAWVDFLRLDRPLLLCVPDLERYTATRGLKSPPFYEIMEYALCTSPTHAEAFFESVATNRSANHSVAREALGFTDSPDVVGTFFAKLELLAAQAGVTMFK